MTNTIFGLLSLLFVITLITLCGSCNRNNTKTETKATKTTTDSLAQIADSLSKSAQMQKDSITLDDIADKTSDTTKIEEPSLQENSLTEDGIKKDTVMKEQATKTEKKSSADFKENTNKPATTSSGGIKAVDNIKDVLSGNKPKGRVIIIGSGGGVTGAVTTYKVYEDGSLFENHTLNTNEPQKKLSVLKNAEAIQKQFDALNIDAINLNAPGNMYFFVAYEKDNLSHRCTWGANDVEVPENLKTFYTNLMNTISENRQQNR